MIHLIFVLLLSTCFCSGATSPPEPANSNAIKWDMNKNLSALLQANFFKIVEKVNALVVELLEFRSSPTLTVLDPKDPARKALLDAKYNKILVALNSFVMEVHSSSTCSPKPCLLCFTRRFSTVYGEVSGPDHVDLRTAVNKVILDRPCTCHGSKSVDIESEEFLAFEEGVAIFLKNIGHLGRYKAEQAQRGPSKHTPACQIKTNHLEGHCRDCKIKYLEGWEWSTRLKLHRDFYHRLGDFSVFLHKFVESTEKMLKVTEKRSSKTILRTSNKAHTPGICIEVSNPGSENLPPKRKPSSNSPEHPPVKVISRISRKDLSPHKVKYLKETLYSYRILLNVLVDVRQNEFDKVLRGIFDKRLLEVFHGESSINRSYSRAH